MRGIGDPAKFVTENSELALDAAGVKFGNLDADRAQQRGFSTQAG
jgi:hypothetical protein